MKTRRVSDISAFGWRPDGRTPFCRFLDFEDWERRKMGTGSAELWLVESRDESDRVPPGGLDGVHASHVIDKPPLSCITATDGHVGLVRYEFFRVLVGHVMKFSSYVWFCQTSEADGRLPADFLRLRRLLRVTKEKWFLFRKLLPDTFTHLNGMLRRWKAATRGEQIC